jgi:uncharacterized protein YdeI (YjbR/CyaY-like superfamily)
MAEVLPELLLHDVAEWRTWLAEHADDERGVRLVLVKKGGGAPTTLTYADALQEALCHGWIDGQSGRRDEATYLVRFTPRRARSLWSKRNVDHIARLVEEGRMQPRGLAEVARAQADGRWEAAYSGPAGIEVPDELARALAADPPAQALWERLNGQNRYAILHRLEIAIKAETRTRLIGQYVAMLARGETIYPQPGLPATAQPAGADPDTAGDAVPPR